MPGASLQRGGGIAHRGALAGDGIVGAAMKGKQPTRRRPYRVGRECDQRYAGVVAMGFSGNLSGAALHARGGCMALHGRNRAQSLGMVEPVVVTSICGRSELV